MKWKHILAVPIMDLNSTWVKLPEREQNLNNNIYTIRLRLKHIIDKLVNKAPNVNAFITNCKSKYYVYKIINQ